MSNSELIRLAEQFEKEAGLLKFPAKTFNEMKSWASSVIATKILANIDAKIGKIRPARPGMNKAQARAIRQKIVEFRFLRNELKKIIRESGFQQEVDGTSINNNFIIDTNSLPYREPSAERSHKSDINLEVGVYVMFANKTTIRIPGEEGVGVFESEHSTPAYYLPNQNQIVIDCSDYSKIDNMEDLKDYMSNRVYFIRHELQHAVQYQIPRLKNERGEGKGLLGLEMVGLGPKKQRTHWDLDESTPHPLKAQEFYTRLSDDLREFRIIKSHIPLIYSRAAFYYWICEIELPDFKHHVFRDMIKRTAPKEPESVPDLHKRYDKTHEEFDRLVNTSRIGHSDFFSALKTHNMEAYKKAVKEFSKAIGAIL